MESGPGNLLWTELSRHNDKAWFEQHRDDYETYFMAPAKQLVEALAKPLKKLDPKLHAEPRVNGSILRINRDVRFSKNKAPYKITSTCSFGAAKAKAGTTPVSSFGSAPPSCSWARAELLKHGGLYSGWEGKHPKELGTARFIDFVIAHFAEAVPLHHWLVDVMKSGVASRKRG